ncbi:MAG TPA: endopeptidase La [Oligoflexus sp.]|uniref:endopeptidase La n=1 Tax=Oligoflexus sp. TaxID=1971216 RepID=UPI002D2FFBE5|nr:endopeptidase La [Oligoflexus sp.]HYX37802.1 endopeptidase La [Oligoflexus sp.]
MTEFANRWVPAMVSSQFVLFPSTAMPVTVTDEKNLAALREMKARGLKNIHVVTRKDAEKPISQETVYSTSCLAEVEYIKGNDTAEVQLIVRGLERHHISEISWDNDACMVRTHAVVIDQDIDTGTVETYLNSIKELSDKIIAFLPGNMKQVGDMLRAIDDPELLVNLIAPHLEVDVALKASLLSEISLNKRLMMLLETMQDLRQSLEIRAEIGRKVSHKFNKQHRDAMLRQQMRVIQEELGEGGMAKNSYTKRIEEHTDMPEDVKKVALEEAQRLAGLERNSPEAPGMQNYLDLLLSLPWKPGAKQDINLNKARDILNSHHYGLEKVKDRIVQHLAVLKLKENFRGSILLLVGPPGVGKTSLGRSIAESMGRDFVRASLGGVRDEAEIRGHRRTYIGSRPGRIIQALKQCKQNNPVFLLDEIDKLSQSYNGDPAAALLEVLDPEQNNSFRDHFMEVPYDLSQVMFVATANSLETIPGPLRDRMEVISIAGYTTAEKLHIAKQHLWPEQMENHGVKPSQLTIADDALLRLISHYTREAGVRELKRKLAALIRGSTEAIIQSETGIQIRPADLERLLGSEPFTLELAEAHMPAGVVTGLAWTPMGGDILFIEAKAMPGKGQLTLTGQMGEVMKESVQIAMTHVRSLLPSMKTQHDYEKTDVHVHVPAGAIPKDGPSAGVTMLTSLASLFSHRPVNPSLAMTGEITLRGAVTAVGGIKEKVLAAHRAGIKKILMSERNRKDIQDVPQEVRDELEFVFVSRVEEVLKEALGLDLVEKQGAAPEPESGRIARL